MRAGGSASHRGSPSTRAWIVGLGCAACTPSIGGTLHPTQSAPPSTMVQRASVQAPPTAGVPRTTCGEVLRWRAARNHKAALANKATECTVPSAIYGTACVEGDAGMWALVETTLSIVCEPGPNSLGRTRGEVALTYIPHDSSLTISMNALAAPTTIAERPLISDQLPVASDSDREFYRGADSTRTISLFVGAKWQRATERAVVVRIRSERSGHLGEGSVDQSQAVPYTLRERAIVPIDLPSALVGVAPLLDADGDGVFDLRLAPYRLPFPQDRCLNYGNDLIGPVQLAFGSAGEFAIDPRDDGQRAAASELLIAQCKSYPEVRALVSDGGLIDVAKSLHNVACMRLHHVPASEVTARLTRECHGAREANGCAHQSRTCPDALFEWAAQPLLQETRSAF